MTQTNTDKTVSQPEDTTLWCVNITGPDDVLAVANRAEAVEISVRFNTFAVSRFEKDPHPYAPMMWAVPRQWPHSAASHAENLGDLGEYSWLREASRTQSPAEWQVERFTPSLVPNGRIKDAGMIPSPDGLWVRYSDALRAASITPPAPERSKEEVVEALFQAVVPFIAGTAWREVRAALSVVLEPASLHKGDPTEEMIVAGLGVDFDNEDERATVINVWHAMSAAAPLPVTITDALTAARGMIATREHIDELGWGKGTSPATPILKKIDAALAALSKPGEQ